MDLQAEQLSPENPDIPENHGRALYSIGLLDESTAALQRSLELNPDNSDAYNYLGLAAELQSKTAQAMEHYRKAVELDTENPEARMNLARLFVLTEKSQEAFEHLQVALRVFEERSDVAGLSWVHADLGWNYYKLGDWAHSIEESRKALELTRLLNHASTLRSHCCTPGARRRRVPGTRPASRTSR